MSALPHVSTTAPVVTEALDYHRGTTAKPASEAGGGHLEPILPLKTTGITTRLGPPENW
ncbi:hypothetical protein ACFVJH_02150 [Streptomyces decoyicus]|uniref:hypothetical protein n=1 Tax=Streptomyces decoyicus TaxID=249567 RepID=UPI0036391CB8